MLVVAIVGGIFVGYIAYLKYCFSKAETDPNFAEKHNRPRNFSRY